MCLIFEKFCYRNFCLAVRAPPQLPVLDISSALLSISYPIALILKMAGQDHLSQEVLGRCLELCLNKYVFLELGGF